LSACGAFGIVEYNSDLYSVSYSGDKPLSDALHLMNNEGVSSIVVVDYHLNVIGNISTADVKVHGLFRGLAAADC
jgi:CBS domain-containing protein